MDLKVQIGVGTYIKTCKIQFYDMPMTLNSLGYIHSSTCPPNLKNLVANNVIHMAKILNLDSITNSGGCWIIIVNVRIPP